TAGLYAGTTAALVQWLARIGANGRSRLSEFRERMPGAVEAWATKLPAGAHARSAENAAELLFGLEMFLNFAVDAGAVTEREVQDRLEQARQAFADNIGEQDKSQAADDVPVRSIELLKSALVMGRAHLHSVGVPAQHVGASEPIGWQDTEAVYIEP